MFWGKPGLQELKFGAELDFPIGKWKNAFPNKEFVKTRRSNYGKSCVIRRNRSGRLNGICPFEHF